MDTQGQIPNGVDTERDRVYDEVIRDNLRYLTLPAWEQSGGVFHAFTTRINGLGGRRNGSRHSDDWNAAAKAIGISPDRLVTVDQVHGERIARVDERNYRSITREQADAMITNTPGLAIGVETADCVPVLLYDPATRSVGAVHAGWRSTVKKIARHAVMRMCDEFGADPSRMLAAIGPAIGPECYEVDELVMGPVRETFAFWKDAAARRENNCWGLDLVKLNARELIETGMQQKNIHALGLCTSCRKDLFYSFRAEGKTGRMLSVIMIKS